MSLSPQHPDSVAAVRTLYEKLLDAWNQRDARGYAALFTEDAALIGFDGSQVAGSDVGAHLTQIFADHPTAAYVWQVRDLNVLGEGVVLLRANVGMVPPGHDELNPATNAVQSLVAVRRSDTWRIALLQNTPAQYHGRPHLVDQHTAELRQILHGSRGQLG
jgi:uncharacterized protein (TIGR02246 family)